MSASAREDAGPECTIGPGSGTRLSHRLPLSFQEGTAYGRHRVANVASHARSRHDKEVYNGDFGYIEDVDLDTGEVIVNFDDRSVTYGFGELDVLVPAYAATIHKSQGSEYPAVVIAIMTEHYALLQRNLLYTVVTRGRLVASVGQKKAVAIAVRNVSGRRRRSRLKEWLGVASAPYATAT